MGFFESPSERLVHQRMRNRAYEAVELLAEGPDGVREIGTAEFIELFFDVIDDDAPWRWREWSVFTPEEVAALRKIHAMLLQVCEDTKGIDEEEAFIATGWPERIQVAAIPTTRLFRDRGFFDEEIEEEHPTRRSR